MRKFTVEMGIAVQAEQLQCWKQVLLPDAYASLEEFALQNNATAEDGFGITRGVTLSNYVANYAHNRKLGIIK